MSSLSWEHAVEMRHALTVIVTDPDYGVSALSNVRTMTNLLNDLLPDAPREKSALIGAADARVSEILLDRIGQGMDPRLAINQASSALAAATVFPREVCDSVTREIATAIGIRQVEADTMLPPPMPGPMPTPDQVPPPTPVPQDTRTVGQDQYGGGLGGVGGPGGLGGPPGGGGGALPDAITRPPLPSEIPQPKGRP